MNKQSLFYAFIILIVFMSCGNLVNGDPESPTTAIWARSVSTGSLESHFYSAAVDSFSNVYTVGYQRGNGTYTYGTGVSATGVDQLDNIVLVKYNSSGKAQWARTVIAGLNSTYLKSVAVDNLGNVYVAGYQIGNGTYTYGAGVSATGTNSSFYNAVLIKYNASGTAQWARTVSTGNKDSFFDSVAVDGSGNVYTAGNQAGTGIFTYGIGVTAAGSSTSNNVVLVKYNSDGSALWARTVSSGLHNSLFQSVAIDAVGDVFAAGYCYGAGMYTFGSGVSISGGNSSAPNSIIVKYNSDGTAQWARLATGDGDCEFYSLALDSSGFIYAAGFQENGTYDYGNGVSLESAIINFNAVLVKYNTDGEAQWARTVSTGENYSIFFSVTVDSLNNIYAGGCVKGSSLYTFGPEANVAGSSVEANAVLVKYNSDGEAQLARTVSSGSLNSYFRAVAVNSTGYVYAAGEQEGSGTYTYSSGASARGSSSAPNAVLVKYSP